MLKQRIMISLCLIGLFLGGLLPDAKPACLCLDQAPIGVMGSHSQNEGEIMWSYRYMPMAMSTVMTGTQSLDSASYFNDTSYMSYLTDMRMEMHMIGAMWAPMDEVTLMVMGHYKDLSMGTQKMDGETGRMATQGWGDTQLMALIPIIKALETKCHVNLGVSLPTGAIDATSNDMVVGYPMQLGSGTTDLMPGVTYIHYLEALSLGAQVSGVYRLGTNQSDYRLGHQLVSDLWVAKPWTEDVSTSVRLSYQHQTGIQGAHSGIMNTGMTAATDSVNSGSKQWVASTGVNGAFRDGLFAGYRVALEISVPVSRDVEGVQMVADASVIVGIQRLY